MHKAGLFILLTAITLQLGCGKSQPVAQPTQPESQPTTAGETSPAEVVSQFLDRVRRGGVDSGAGDLLTQKAQSELARIGRSVQPIGSPDASFKVTRSEQVPGEDQARLVQSIWTEPNADGTQSSYEVVWAMQRETNGWRISGLAMEMIAGQPPMVVNFEDGELMAKLLPDEPAVESSGNPSQAAAPASTINR